jgi:hypothetical protein
MVDRSQGKQVSGNKAWSLGHWAWRIRHRVNGTALRTSRTISYFIFYCPLDEDDGAIIENKIYLT